MKRHALFVGVDRYEDGHIPDLSCAVNDATDLHGFFKFGVGYDKVELLQNPSGKKDILCAVRDLTADLGPGDFFLFFFAGHGFRVGENHVLVCANDFYDDVKHEDDGLSLGQLKRHLARAFDSALVLDACQSDILATRGGEGIAERDLDLILDTSRDGICGGSLTIVTSCDVGQTAAELIERHHGLFTVAILDLLNEARESNMRIDFSDVFRQNLTRRMCEIATQSGLHTEQRPRFNCAGNSCFVLLDGAVVSSTDQTPLHASAPSVATPIHVVCPICGKKNKIEDTFKCRQCGRDNLCLRHQDEKMFLCAKCIASHDERSIKYETTQANKECNHINKIIILGYSEWYAICPKIRVFIDGKEVGLVSRNGKLVLTVKKECIEVAVEYATVFKRRSTPVLFKCRDGELLLRINTHRWTTGALSIEEYHN